MHRSQKSGWFSRKFQITFKRSHPVRLLGMALFLALPFYIILYLYIPSNGLEDGQLVDAIHIPQINNMALRQEERGKTDHVGRVLMKGKDLQDNRTFDKDIGIKPVTMVTNHTKQTEKVKEAVIEGIRVVYMGCFSDVTMKKRRALQGAFYSDVHGMTVGRCLQYCSSKNYPFSGMEFSSECYCGHAITGSRASGEGACNMTCSGNINEICGGAPYISVYQIKTPGQSAVNQAVPEKEVKTGRRYDFRACVPRPQGRDGSVFTGGILQDLPSVSLESCVQSCGDQSHPLAGLSLGTQCHCGMLTEDFDLQDKINPDLCNVPCIDDEQHFCGSEEHVSIYQTSHQDERCSGATLKAAGSLPLIAVASFPGSGNTWVRYLIERASGIYTGSYYDDGDLFNKGYKGEREPWTKRNTIAVKTHRFDGEHVSTFDGAILILRDPYKAILSEHNRKFGGHTGYASERHYTHGTEWIDFVTGKSRTWTNTAINFLEYNKNVLVVHYEDLRSNLKPNLEKMMKFLKVPINKERILCTISSPDGKYKRPPAKQKLSFDPYTDEMKEFVTLYIKSVSMALYIRNQTQMPDSYNPHLKFLLWH